MGPLCKVSVRALVVGCILFCLPLAHAAQTADYQIELTDGSVIQGEVLSFSGGIYTIVSKSLGTITLPKDKINSFQKIENKQVVSQRSVSESATGADDPRIQKVQERLMEDPETVRMIQNLKNDPEMQKILQDPEIMRAIQQGNLHELGQDSRIKALMKNKTVEEIIQKNQNP